MASPYHPHAQPGPSYYPHPPPPPPPPHYAYPPAPPPAPYYPYAMPPMSAPAPPMHQPASPRINGAGRGRYHRGGPAYHYPQIPQHHMPPTVPVQTPPPASPASPFLHPQKFAPHPHPHQVPYGSPYHHPQPNGPYPPHAWAGHTQTHSPLPKQLPMLPPMVAHEHVPQLQQPQLPHHPQPQPQPPPETHQRHQPALSHIAPDVPHINSPEAPQTGSEQEGPPRQGTPPREAEESHAVSSEPKELAESIHHDDSESIELVSEVAETSEQVAPQYTEEAEARAATPNSSSVDVDESLPPLPSTYVIWSRRPGDPNHAPGVIVSTRAYPPEDVIQKALELRTPPATPKPQVVPLAQTPIPVGLDIQEESAESVAPPSSTAETTPACSVVADTPVPGSPYSSATSVSVAVSSPPAKTSVSSHIEAKVDSETTEPSTPQPSVDQAQASAVSTSTTPAVASKAAAGPKKSWASLLQSSDSAASSSKPRLPVSNVVGFSIPASSGAPSQTPGTSVASANRNELLHLLHEGPSGSAANIAAGMKIRPRGLVNTGNMCFANAVLQILVYCPPFHRLFSELRRHLAGPVVGSQREGSKATPLVDATIQFLKEFVPDPPAPGPAANSKAKGKEREDDGFEELESFIPTYIYDAMKEKKRFANMIGGHQEDAEEFLGFYLDTLEEELLSISQPSQPKQPSPTTVGDAPTQDDGWLEVGKKNKAVTTRTSRSTESPITRIFGGKFRSSLRSPHQRESVTIEDWRSLQLDIQPEDVKTLRDALQHISHPQSVQISIPTRPGAILDATQQVLIDALPPVLILHMKRFLYDTKVGDVVKVGKQVSFSQELDIPSEIISPAKRTSQGIKYQLFGVLYHHGLSASGGHYTLDVLHPNRELSDRPRAAWIRIDDELVSDLRPEDVFGGQEREDRQPYLLFYRRMTAWGSARTN